MTVRWALSLALLAALSATFGFNPHAGAREARPAPPVATQASEFRFAPSQPGVRETYIVSFGLFGGQSVFESEARGAAEILSQRLAEALVVVRFNTKRGGTATPSALAAALKAAGRVMDPSEDLLVVALTSHGSPDGLAVTAGRRRGILSPSMLKTMLDASGATYRVLIVSACYSGVFARALAAPRTLVITAASADRPSFGCQDGATWTYFGDAFYNQALRRQASLDTAFAEAKRLVTERERREGFEPSDPQIAGGAEVLALLARR
jgi:hypothetical protein